MADNVMITPGSGATIATDSVNDGVLGNGVQVQFVKMMDGTLDSTNKLIVDSSGRAATLATQTGTWTVQPGNTPNTTPWLSKINDGTNSAAVDATHGLKVLAFIDSSSVNPNGQAAMANSAPVVIASDQSALKTTPLASASANGQTSSRVDSAASTNATSLKASAGTIVNIDVFNVAAYDVFLKFYNKASAPTVGTDTPIWTIPIKSGTGYSRSFPLGGKACATGVAYAITKLQADSDTTVVAAHDLTGSIDWI